MPVRTFCLLHSLADNQGSEEDNKSIQTALPFRALCKEYFPDILGDEHRLLPLQGAVNTWRSGI